MNASLNQRLLQLSGLLQLEQRARQVRGAELGFLIVNETHGVVPYQQAILWRAEPRGGAEITLSGVAEAPASAPYRAWAQAVARALAKGSESGQVHAVAPAALTTSLGEEWAEWFPAHALWCPLKHPDGALLGALILGRAEAWTPADEQLLDLLAAQYGQCLALEAVRGHRRRHVRRGIGRKALVALGVIGAAILLALPVRRSVIAPAEVVAIDPAPVRAPFDGVVAAVLVAPNAEVHAGDKLVALERSQLQTQYDVAAKALELARVEFGVTSQQAVNDPKAKARLALLGGKVEQREAELAYAKGLLDRSILAAPIDGVAVFDNPAEWIGKPVAVGERIMQVAAPRHTQLEVSVPAADAVTFATGAPISFFSNLAPDEPATATLDYASYTAAPTADGTMAYTFRGQFGADAAQRLGVKGSAKIYGPPQALGLWLLRRPLAAVRQWLAL